VAISVPASLTRRICVEPMRSPRRVTSAVAMKCAPMPWRRWSTRRSIVPMRTNRCSTCIVFSSACRSPIATISAKPPIASSVAEITPPCSRPCEALPISAGRVDRRMRGSGARADS
jgi:hypothetical protein